MTDKLLNITYKGIKCMFFVSSILCMWWLMENYQFKFVVNIDDKGKPSYVKINYNINMMNDRSESIIDGSTKESYWPWLAMILSSDNSMNCNGVLIHNRYVLTTAYCVHKLSGHSDDLTVVLGTNNLSNIDPTQRYDAYGVSEHEMSEKKEGNFYSYNMAILTLTRPVQESTKVSKIHLPDLNTLPGNMNYQKAIVAGWGSIDESETFSNQTYEAAVQLSDNYSCRNSTNSELFFSHYCGFRHQKNSKLTVCKGDSGSPLMIKINGKWTLIGLASFHRSAQKTRCMSDDLPSYFTNVPLCLEWIHNFTNNSIKSN